MVRSPMAKVPTIIGPDGMKAPTSVAGFPLTIDLRWGPTEAELCRMTFYLDGSVRGDAHKLRTWLSKTTRDVAPAILLQWWTILSMLDANQPVVGFAVAETETQQ